MTEVHHPACRYLLALYLHTIGLWASQCAAAYEQHKANEMRFSKGAKANNGKNECEKSGKKESTKNKCKALSESVQKTHNRKN